MLGGAFGWPHLLILLALILLLFGAAKLPALAKSVGQSARVFKGEMKAMKTDDVAADAATGSASTAAPASTAPPAATVTPAVAAPQAPASSEAAANPGGTAEPKP